MIQKGMKRSLVLMMLVAAPFAYSEPISLGQETLPQVNPKVSFNFIREEKPVVSRRSKATKRKKIAPVKQRPSKAAKGTASWYSKADAFINRHTANGEVFDDRKLTCASWDHSFGTKLQVTNLANGKSVTCRVNDRGPNKRLGRKIDLTLAAFRKIAKPQKGLIKVAVRQVKN